MLPREIYIDTVMTSSEINLRLTNPRNQNQTASELNRIFMHSNNNKNYY